MICRRRHLYLSLYLHCTCNATLHLWPHNCAPQSFLLVVVCVVFAFGIWEFRFVVQCILLEFSFIETFDLVWGSRSGFAGCGIRPFLPAGFGIDYKISRDTRFKLSKRHSRCGIWPKNNCEMREMTWFFARYGIHTPHRGPHSTIVFNNLFCFLNRSFKKRITTFLFNITNNCEFFYS